MPAKHEHDRRCSRHFENCECDMTRPHRQLCNPYFEGGYCTAEEGFTDGYATVLPESELEEEDNAT